MSLPGAIGGSKLRDDDSGLQRVGPLAEVPGVLREFGVDPARVLSEAGLPEGVLDDSGNRITFRAMGRLLECGARATQCPHFGLLVGQRARVDHFGLVGRLIENAPTLGVAIMDFADNQHRYVRGSVIHVLFQNSDCIATYSVYQSRVQAADQIIDAAVASGFRVLTSVSDLEPSEVRLPRRTPDSRSAYRAVFGLTPRFNSGVGALVFPEHRLRHPLRRADASLRRSLEASVAN
jgi:hypothetical protein